MWVAEYFHIPGPKLWDLLHWMTRYGAHKLMLFLNEKTSLYNSFSVCAERRKQNRELRVYIKPNYKAITINACQSVIDHCEYGIVLAASWQDREE